MSLLRRSWWAAVEACLVAIVLLFGTPHVIPQAPAAPKPPQASANGDASSSLRKDIVSRAATAAMLAGGMVAFMTSGTVAERRDSAIISPRVVNMHRKGHGGMEVLPTASRHIRQSVEPMVASAPLASYRPNLHALSHLSMTMRSMPRSDTSAMSHAHSLQSSQR
eukprot:TRINITY_DN28696_c0_g1_i1.p1 TRINITY_DN28696_c0_g1~~TRINITY_DN28696_c0_g1_i1.p1  ORF type:complete len:165 (-),score=21.30 TRINITY_DN28696_c0_g1_i1:391-885(-)